MNKTIVVTCSLLLVATQVDSATVDELIKQNVRDATKAYQKTQPPAQQPTSPARLWIHARNDSQKKLAQEILDKVAKLEFKQWQIEQKPIQQVSAGPPKSQLRYFKRQDQAHAKELYTALRKWIPQLEIKDISANYEHVGWIKPGHFELWLAPELTRLQPQ
jgi:hypothetical protein